MTEPSNPLTQPYKDDDLVYVDPELRTVIGPLEWSRSGNPKSMPVPQEEVKDKDKKERRRRTSKRYYPWGTYRSMKRVFQLEGKLKKNDQGIPFDTALEKALKEAYWD